MTLIWINFYFVNLKNIINPKRDAGLTGLTNSDKELFVVTQSRLETKIFCFDLALNYRYTIQVPECLGAHSMTMKGDEIFLCSTASNKILSVSTTTKKVKTHWDYESSGFNGPRSYSFEFDSFFMKITSML